MIESDLPIAASRTPIRETKLANKTNHKVAIWIADFLMCWFALVGLVNAALDFAGFAFASKLAALGQPAIASDQRLSDFAAHTALSAVGFTYMLWRYNWRCRLTTLLQIMLLSCVALGIAPALQSNVTILPLVVYCVLAVYVIGFTFHWASHPKGIGSQKGGPSE